MILTVNTDSTFSAAGIMEILKASLGNKNYYLLFADEKETG